jgi:hypothetical protein
MPTYTKEQKAARKYTIRQHNLLKKLDAYAPPTAPARVIHHPRFFNAPLACRSGKHQWINGYIMGIPRMKCKKCGRIVMTGSFNGTETKREIRTRNIPKPEPWTTEKDWIESFFEERNRNPRR